MEAREPTWHRRDITGLRALAIVPVVAFHAGATFLPGGFVGVDVFFVISGYLITSLLLREVERTGRVRIGDFWAKRIRRLAPALLVTVAVTLPAAALISSVLAWDQLAAQAVASSVYVANIFFWWRSDGYFDTGSTTSPFLHMWSLGVEEQFYLIWPFIIILTLMAMRRIPFRVRLSIVFGVVFVVSLAWSIYLSPRDPDAAFYLLPTRAWEFAGAGLVALLPLNRLVHGRALPSALAGTGLACIIISVLVFTEEFTYPGAWAVLPVLGTLLILVAGAGDRPHAFAWILQNRFSVWIGQVSYSWYLWHWPLAVFAAAVFQGNQIAVALSALVSLALAAMSFYYVETPLRFKPWLTVSNRRTYLAGMSGTAVILILSASTYVAGGAILRTEPFQTYASAAQTLPTTSCEQAATTGVGEICIDGDADSDTTVALIGDSHAGHWRHEFGQVAQDLKVRLLVRWRSGCPSLQVPMVGSTGETDAECIKFQEGTIKALEELKPDAVIISNAAGYIDVLRGSDHEALPKDQRAVVWEAALRAQINQMEDLDAVVGVIDDNPRMPFNPTECLTRLWTDVADCTATRAESLALIDPLAPVTRAVSQAEGLVEPMSVTDAICGPTECVAATPDGIPVYQDQTHLSRAWTSTQRAAVTAFIHRLLGDGHPFDTGGTVASVP